MRLGATHAGERQHVIIVLRNIVGLARSLLRYHTAALAAGAGGECTLSQRVRVRLAHVADGVGSSDGVRR